MDYKEIIPPGLVDKWIGWAALGYAGLAGVVGSLLWSKRPKAAVKIASVAMLGPLVYLLWVVHNLFMEHIGFDRTATVGADLAAAVAIGLAVGLVMRKVFNSRA